MVSEDEKAYLWVSVGVLLVIGFGVLFVGTGGEKSVKTEVRTTVEIPESSILPEAQQCVNSPDGAICADVFTIQSIMEGGK